MQDTTDLMRMRIVPGPSWKRLIVSFACNSPCDISSAPPNTNLSAPVLLFLPSLYLCLVV